MSRRRVRSAAMPLVLPPIAAVDLRPRDAGVLAGQMLFAELDESADEPRVQQLLLRFHARGSLRPETDAVDPTP